MKKPDVDIFADTLNHDIKSLLTSVKAYSQLLLLKTKCSLDKHTFTYVISLDKQVDALIALIAKQNLVIKKRKKTVKINT